MNYILDAPNAINHNKNKNATSHQNFIFHHKVNEFGSYLIKKIEQFINECFLSGLEFFDRFKFF